MSTDQISRHLRIARILFIAVCAVTVAKSGAIAADALIPGATPILAGDRFVGGSEPMTGRSAATDAATCGTGTPTAGFGSVAERLVFGADELRCGGYVTRPAGTDLVFAP